MNVGDLVMRAGNVVWFKCHGDPTCAVGIVLEWYDTPKDMVTVAWWLRGELIETNPIHSSKLEVLSEAR
jgi:hypothetical protein